VRIRSSDNPLYRHVRRLAESPRTCRTAKRSIAEGTHLVEAALEAGVRIEAVVLAEDAGSEVRALGDRVSMARQVRLVEFSRALYESISPVEHGAGILAEIAIEARVLPRAEVADAVYLDAVQDPGNAGALLRTAAAAGVRNVAAASGTAFLWAPKVLRAAMGAHFSLSIFEDVAPEAVAAAFTGERLAADAYAGESLYASTWGAGPTVWMFGSEGQGLSAESLAQAQRRLRIPIEPRIESLNVAAAAAVCLFEQRRRRI
jgi:TrmH family RNA methyltransferase